MDASSHDEAASENSASNAVAHVSVAPLFNVIRAREKHLGTKDANNRKLIEDIANSETFPLYRASDEEMLKSFDTLRRTRTPRSIGGLATLAPTQRERLQTKFRDLTWEERWQSPERRSKLFDFFEKICLAKDGKEAKGSGMRNITKALKRVAQLQWGSINTMRPAAAKLIYEEFQPTCVLDFTAGWGARMIAAMVLNIDYIGIDANVHLQPGMDDIRRVLSSQTSSHVTMMYTRAEHVDFSKLDYDFIFTSPPYEYLEVYREMPRYDGERKQPKRSAQLGRPKKTEQFYTQFLIPTIVHAYTHLPAGKYMCLNIPPNMYAIVAERFRPCDEEKRYDITRRVGGGGRTRENKQQRNPVRRATRRSSEPIYCWRKR